MVEIEPEVSAAASLRDAILEGIRGKKLVVATPCYGGNCHSAHALACVELAFISRDVGCPIQFQHMFNESLVQRARNRLVANFLRTDATHLMFIDADVGFCPTDVVHILSLCGEDRPIVGGAYSKKSINWARVATAAKQGLEDPEALRAAAVDACINLPPGTTQLDIGEPAEVVDLPTGFMMIHRSVFEKMAAAYPQILYKDDHTTDDSYGKDVHAFFDCYIDEKSQRYLSEDYGFVRRWQALGGKVYLCPWIRTQHYGSYAFSFDLASLSRNNLAL